MDEKNKKMPKKDDLVVKVTKEFPEKALGVCRHITEGWDHDVLIFDNKYVFRFPNDLEYEALLKNEVSILSRLRPLVNCNIPIYKYVASDFSFAGYDIVPGLNVTPEYFRSLEKSTQQNIILQISDFLSSLHNSINKGHNFPELTKNVMHEDQMEIKKQVEKFLKPILIESDYRIVQEIMSDIDNLLLQKLPQIFVHHDMYYRHIFWDEPMKKLGIIDFSDMHLGDPALDFAELYEYGDDFVDQLYINYTGPKDSSFLSRAKKYLHWIGVYMMTDHFLYQKTSFEEARETFDRVKFDKY